MKSFRGFIGIPAKNPVGTGCAKEISEIWLTAGVIQIESPDCPPDEKTNN